MVDAQIASKLMSSNMLKASDIIARSDKDDIVEEHYHILLTQPIVEISNEFCRYYHAQNLQNHQEFFAIVFERNYNVPIDQLCLLKNADCKGFNPIVALSITRLSNSKIYAVVAIVPKYDYTNNLLKLLESGPLANDIIEQRLIPPLVEALEFCDTRHLNCGNINPKNIIILPNQQFMLQEFVNALPHFYQTTPYLAPEIAETVPCGRVSHSVASDIYALGMTVFTAISGKTPEFKEHDANLFNAERFQERTYNIIKPRNSLSEKFKNFLCWTLHEDLDSRWKLQHINEWLTNRLPLSIHPVSRVAKQNSILFTGRTFSEPRALAAAMYAFYDEAIEFVKDVNLLKWVQQARGKNNSLEEAVDLTRDSWLSGGLEDIAEVTFLRSMITLDPHPNIRLSRFAITMPSLSNVLFYCSYRNRTEWLQNILRILKRRYWLFAITPEIRATVAEETIDKLNAISNYLEADNTAFAVDVVLYVMNPYIPCMSPLILNDFVLSSEDLLTALENIATKTPEKLVIDSHIMAFLTAHSIDTNSPQTDSRNNFAKSPLYKGMLMIARLQEKFPDVKIPNLCLAMSKKMTKWVEETLHNVKLRKAVMDEISELGKKGVIVPMLNVTANPKLFYNDQVGYQRAYAEAMALDKQIQEMVSTEHKGEIGIFLGQKITVFLSYALCMLVALMLII